LPYEGRYDALNPTIFTFDKKRGQFISLSEVAAIDGECRDAKWINYSGSKKIMVLARNNNRLTFLKPDF
jgi:enediyne biosynthesis protein E4